MSEATEIPFCYPQPRLENSLVSLKIFDPTIHTSPFVSAIKAHPSILKYIVFPTVETDADFHSKVYLQAATSAGECFYAIIDKSKSKATSSTSDSYAGVLCLLSTSTSNASTEVGAFIFPEFQRTHVTSNAVGLLLQYVLDPPSAGGLGLRRVEWRCHPDNTASRKTAEGLGFVLEGILRWQRVFPGGEEGLTLGVEELERRNGTSGEVPGRHTAVYSIVWDEWDEKREMVVRRMERKR